MPIRCGALYGDGTDGGGISTSSGLRHKFTDSLGLPLPKAITIVIVGYDSEAKNKQESAWWTRATTDAGLAASCARVFGRIESSHSP